MEKLLSRIKLIILNPNDAWKTIQQEEGVVSEILKHYVLPLAAIPALASLIGYWLVGVNVPIWGRMASFEWGLSQAITSYVSLVAGVLIAGWVISYLAPKFNANVSPGDAVKMVAYSYTPVFIAGVFYLIPSLGIIASLAGIYGLYILYLGFEPITRVPKDKQTTYFVISLLVLILVYFLLGLIIAAFLGVFGLSGTKQF
ncbi:MAG: YIP1 family protein [Prolixibacteraceae bacterium]|nr:YIP1 family protein [Prolixibacteraceae bacterium]